METRQRNRRREPAAQRRMVDRWNAAHPIGTVVTVRKDDGSLVETRTRSEAWLLGEHTAVVLLVGISGGYLLERVAPLTPTER